MKIRFVKLKSKYWKKGFWRVRGHNQTTYLFWFIGIAFIKEGE